MPGQSRFLRSASELMTTCNQRKRPILLVIAMLLAILPNISHVFSGTTSRLDRCYINRENERPPRTFIPIRDGPLHDLSVFFMWIAMFTLCLLPNQRPLAFFRVIYASLWFHSTYILLAALKSLLADYNCAARREFFPNGISGHYCYFLFVSLTAARLGLARAEAHRHTRIMKPVTAVAQVLLFLFFVGAVSTLYRTYFHGYHSLRQISLGMALGLASFVSLDYVLFPTQRKNSIVLMVSALFANSLTSISLYFQWWPHKEAGPAISGQQLVFHSVLWMFLILTISLLPKVEKEKES